MVDSVTDTLTVRRKSHRPASPALALPAIGLLLVFYLLPNVLNLLLGLTDWNSYRDRINFVGLDNFASLISTNVLGQAVSKTLVFSLVAMSVQNVAALALALALERPGRANGILRTIFILPVLISPLAAGFVFHALLAPEGTANQLVGWLVGRPIEVAWLGSTGFTVFVVAVIHAWKWMGLTMIIYLAGLLAIPVELEESARIDGGTELQVIRRIKLPLLAPAFTANLVLTLIGALGAFELILATTRGGPGSSTSVLNIVLFQYWGQGLFGVATAVNLVLFLMVFAAATPLIIYLRRRETEL